MEEDSGGSLLGTADGRELCEFWRGYAEADESAPNDLPREVAMEAVERLC
jgi:hypothetical protein